MRKAGLKQHSVPLLLADFSEMNPTKLTPNTRTVYQHLSNVDAKSKAQTAADHQILNTIEEATLISFIQKLTAHAFPLGHQQIILHALQLVQIHHPSCKSMSYSWFCQFKSCHPKGLKAAWTKNLDTSHAATVNPIVIEHYYKPLEATLLKYAFTPSEIYGFDESGFPFSGDGICECIYGGDGSIQH